MISLFPFLFPLLCSCWKPVAGGLQRLLVVGSADRLQRRRGLGRLRFGPQRPFDLRGRKYLGEYAQRKPSGAGESRVVAFDVGVLAFCICRGSELRVLECFGSLCECFWKLCGLFVAGDGTFWIKAGSCAQSIGRSWKQVFAAGCFENNLVVCSILVDFD